MLLLSYLFFIISYFNTNYHIYSDNHYYEKFEDGTINDITEEIPFEIPDSWYFIRFNNLINYKIGKTPARGEKSLWNTDYNWVSISDMIDGKTIKSTKEMVSQKAYDKIFNADISPKGTLLMSFKLTIGKVSILDIDSFHNEAIISIYPYFDDENTVRDYLFKVLPLISNYGNTKNAIKGKTLNSKSINSLLIPITNLKELNKITNKINSLEPIITNYSSKYMKLEILNNSYKDELKKSILQYAIQGKLVNQDPNDESAEVLINKILDEKRELIKTKQIKKENLSVIYKDSTDNQFYEKFDDGTINNITDEIPFDIPINWSWTKLRNIGIYKKGPFGSALTKSIFVPKSDNTIKVYEQKNAIQKSATLGDYYITNEYFEKNMTGFEVLPNDIIVSCAGTIGETFVMPKEMEKGIINQALMRMRISELFPQDYFLLYFDYVLKKFSAKKSIGSAIKNIPPFEVFKEFLVAVPPIEEQKRILNKLNIMFNIIKTAE